MTKKKVSKKKSGAKMRGPKTKVSSKTCKDYCPKNKVKDIPLPPPIPEYVNFQVVIPTQHKILTKLRNIRDKVFASFGFGSKNNP